MDVRSVELFLHLSQSLHFAKTSQAMHVSASTLSRVIQRLEDELGSSLFTRDKRSVHLTQAGQRFRSFAEQWLEQWRLLQMDLSLQSNALAGELTLYCSVTASYSHLPDILDKYRLSCPNADIKLATGDVAMAVDKVANGEVDIAIAARPDHLPLNIAFASISKIPLSIIGPTVSCNVRKLLERNPIPWDQVPFILPEHGPARARIDHWFKAMRITPNVHAKVAGHEAIVSMVALGSGVGIAPEVVVDNSPVRERIQSVAVGVELEPFDLGICMLSRRLHEPLMQRFWQIAARN
ncbi:HTH-type transcriptional activator IlvY [Agarivorans sp. 1_MG-2023]|uniref:HTH-type transcriptional activator IlvY n=1 Tax=Agarivorans sp. 1_MG-2023 TaxID=3062634 RepID=UPI0026E15348|nr:HTH-type transcriptional activator IlvY [Agarivorans sp. 1_MG-2023]MDO6763325.1 HTH-type transcriptional activator IlvY [Agarivorans sp. 1_MG-2023]